MASLDTALLIALASAAGLLSGCGSQDVVPSFCSGENNETTLHKDAAKAFDIDDAIMHAELATAAYCGTSSQVDNKALLTWDCGAPCDKFRMAEVRVVTSDRQEDAFAFVAKTAADFEWGGGRCILSFRGTTNTMGWINDLLSAANAKLNTWTDIPCQANGTPCQVGVGWIKVYASYSAFIKGNLSAIGCGPGDGSLTVTGHSLGAAQVGLAMLDLKNDGYNVLPTFNFGSPRVGDSTFERAFNAALSPLHLFRLTHHQDPVPHVPPSHFGYQHLDMEIYFGDSSGYLVGDGSGEDPCGADQFGASYTDILELLALCGVGMMFSGCDHLTYLDGYTGHPMTGAACTYPNSTLLV